MVNKLNSIVNIDHQNWSTFYPSLFPKRSLSLFRRQKSLSEDTYYTYSRYTSWTPSIKISSFPSKFLFPPSPFLLVRFLFARCCFQNDVYMSFILAQSGQMMSSPSVMKPRPTNEVLQPAQMKQSLCQCLSSKEMKRVPPMPGNEFETETVSNKWEPGKEDKYSKRIKRYLWSVWSRRCISWRTVPRNNRRNRACRRETWIAGQPGNCYSCYRWSSLCATARSCTLPHRWWWSINDKISFHLYLFIYFPRGKGNFPLRLNGTCILRKESHLVESPQLNAQFNIIENTRYGKSTLVLHLVALNASSGKLVLVARGAIDLLLARDEAFSPDRVLAYHAAEALLVPLPGLVLHLLRTWKDAKRPVFL